MVRFLDPSFKKVKASCYKDHKYGFYVYAKPNKCDPKQVTKYIGRYLGRPVIATSRIDKYDGDNVTFHYNRHEDEAYVEETLPALDFIERLIRGKLEDGQLSESPLSLRDIDDICEAFSDILKGVYHERIEYPNVPHYAAAARTNESSETVMDNRREPAVPPDAPDPLTGPAGEQSTLPDDNNSVSGTEQAKETKNDPR